MSKAGSDNKMQCVHTALKRILTQHGESQGHYTQQCASHRRKADSHTGMKSAYSDSWSLCEFMDSRAEIWMRLGWVLQDQHWGWRVWIRANRSRSLLWDCVLVMSEAIAIKTSLISLPRHDLNEDNSNRYRKQTGKAKQVPLQGSTHHLVIQHEVVRNIHICNTVWTELYLYT